MKNERKNETTENTEPFSEFSPRISFERPNPVNLNSEVFFLKTKGNILSI